VVLVGDLAKEKRWTSTTYGIPPLSTVYDRSWSHPLVIEGRVAASQIQDACASVFVCEDFLEHKQREPHLLQMDFQHRARLQL